MESNGQRWARRAITIAAVAGALLAGWAGTSTAYHDSYGKANAMCTSSIDGACESFATAVFTGCYLGHPVICR